MDASSLASAESWLSIIGSAKLIAAFLVAIGVAIEFGGDWVAKPFENIIEDARKLELTKLTKETVRLSAEAESSRAAISDANARAAEANKIAEGERLARLKLEARVAPRRIRGEQRQKMVAVLSAARPSGVAIVSRLLDSEGLDFAEDIAAAFKASNWQAPSYSNWTRSDKGVFIATIEGTAPDPTDHSLLAAALDAAEIAHTTIVIRGEDINRMSPHFQPQVLYLLIGAKPE